MLGAEQTGSGSWKVFRDSTHIWSFQKTITKILSIASLLFEVFFLWSSLFTPIVFIIVLKHCSQQWKLSHLSQKRKTNAKILDSTQLSFPLVHTKLFYISSDKYFPKFTSSIPFLHLSSYFCTIFPVLPHCVMPQLTLLCHSSSCPIPSCVVTPRLSLSSHPILSCPIRSLPSYSFPPPHVSIFSPLISSAPLPHIPFSFSSNKSCFCINDLEVKILTNTMWICPKSTLYTRWSSQALSDCLNKRNCVL